MTDEESARIGENDAKRLFRAIDSSLALPGIDAVMWWGGFMAALGAKAYMDVGPTALSIISATSARALENVIIKGPKQ